MTIQNNYHVPLTLPVRFLTGEFNKAKYDRTMNFDQRDISEEWLIFFADIGLKLVAAKVFYKSPFTKDLPHKDRHDMHDLAKINFVYGGEGSKMIWYSIKEEFHGSKKSDYLYNYTLYDNDDIESIICEAEIQSPSIVQAGIPHTIEVGPNPRWAVSLVYVTSEDQKFLTWDTAVRILSPYIKP